MPGFGSGTGSEEGAGIPSPAAPVQGAAVRFVAPCRVLGALGSSTNPGEIVQRLFAEFLVEFRESLEVCGSA